MKLKTVTITGADNKTNIGDMVSLSKKYPFVEWGILFSPKRKGEARYPDTAWLNDLYMHWRSSDVILSAHLCGGYTAEMLTGNKHFLETLMSEGYMDMFSRFQLNFNAGKHKVNAPAFFQLLSELNFEFILQHNKANAEIVQLATGKKNISFLYDSSGGRGNLNADWKPPVSAHFTGYAGGLSPENLETELQKIATVCGDTEIWIDTETRVRTNDVLDMEKVEQFLEIAEKYV